MKVCFTVDVEGVTYGISLRGMDKLLDLFNDFGVRATFFIEGETLKKERKLLSTLNNYGHEIALHGNHHDPWLTNNIKNKEEDIRKAKETFIEIVKTEPYGFRAPYFNVDVNVLRILEKEGFKYDSSLALTFFRVGNRKVIFQFRKNIVKGMGIVEIPISVLMHSFPLSLGYLNLFGLSIYKFLTKLHKKQLLVFALHSWVSQREIWVEYTVPQFLKAYCVTRPSPLELLKGYMTFLQEQFNPEFVCMRKVVGGWKHPKK